MTFLLIRLYVRLFVQLTMLRITYVRQIAVLKLVQLHFHLGMGLASLLLTASERLLHLRPNIGPLRWRICMWLFDLSTAIADSYGRRCGLLK